MTQSNAPKPTLPTPKPNPSTGAKTPPGPDAQPVRDNRSRQLNPEHPTYGKSRGKR